MNRSLLHLVGLFVALLVGAFAAEVRSSVEEPENRMKIP